MPFLAARAAKPAKQANITLLNHSRYYGNAQQQRSVLFFYVFLVPVFMLVFVFSMHAVMLPLWSMWKIQATLLVSCVVGSHILDTLAVL